MSVWKEECLIQGSSTFTCKRGDQLHNVFHDVLTDYISLPAYQALILTRDGAVR